MHYAVSRIRRVYQLYLRDPGLNNSECSIAAKRCIANVSPVATSIIPEFKLEAQAFKPKILSYCGGPFFCDLI